MPGDQIRENGKTYAFPLLIGDQMIENGKAYGFLLLIGGHVQVYGGIHWLVSREIWWGGRTWEDKGQNTKTQKH